MYELMDFILCTLANTRWEAGDWTDDTDQLLLILQMIVERGGSVDKCVFAGKMRHWRHKGFPELKDVGRPYTLSLACNSCILIILEGLTQWIDSTCICNTNPANQWLLTNGCAGL